MQTIPATSTTKTDHATRDAVTRDYAPAETGAGGMCQCDGAPPCWWAEARQLVAEVEHEAEPCWRCRLHEVTWPALVCGDCRRELETGPVLAGVTTRRVYRELEPRTTAFVDWRTGDGVLAAAGGRRVHCGPRPGPADIAAAVNAERVYLTGPPPDDGAGVRSWGALVPAGWTVDDLHAAREAAPVFKYRDGTGRRVEIMRAAAWFGEGDYSPAGAAGALALVRELLAGAFGSCNLLGSPAATGAELFRAQIPKGEGWPVLSDELREIVAATGQHRIEFTGGLYSGAPTIPRLVEVDGRLMYGALCWGLPAGAPVHAAGWGDYERDAMQPGFYRARWAPPEGWAHVGMLPARRASGDGWCYPAGEAEGWVTGAELALALRHGWWADVSEHVVWPKRATPARGPLDGWANRLVRCRQDLLPTYEYSGEVERQAVELVAHALRHVLIDTLGLFVGRRHTTTHMVDLADPSATIPDGAVNKRPEGRFEASTRWLYETEAHNRWRDELAHPEWTATIWGRARARILSGPPVEGVRTGALHVERDALLAISGDALYLTSEPAWPDDGAVGRLRVKAVTDGPMLAPASLRDVWRLRRGS